MIHNETVLDIERFSCAWREECVQCVGKIGGVSGSIRVSDRGVRTVDCRCVGEGAFDTIMVMNWRYLGAILLTTAEES